MGFHVFSFNDRIRAGIAALGFQTPTPIQAQGIPPVLAGKDLLGLAQTGTGKTAAFVLPILERLSQGPKRVLRALILAPTRELAEQIHEVIRILTPHTGIHSMTVYGGVGMQPQVERLKRGVEIVVACPGRLLDHIGQRTIRFDKLDVLVLDEADRMFDMGFLPDLRRVVAALPKNRQTLLYSATMPEEVHKLTREVLRDPVTIKIGTTAPASTVEHALYPVSQHLKTALLLELLQHTPTGSVLVFTRTKHRAKRVARTLGQKGYKAAELQGNLSQSRRQDALNGFRDGRYRILVATDIAARGIDVSTISHVINYDIPDTVEAYTHRIGRTGRMARTGDAFTFVSPEDTAMVRDIERVLKATIPRRRVEHFDYDAKAPGRDTEFARDPRPPRGGGRGPGGGRAPSSESRSHAGGGRNARAAGRSGDGPSHKPPSRRRRGSY